MGRRVLVGVLIVAAAVGIGVAVAVVTRDDSSDRAGGTTTTTTTVPSTTTSTTTTTTPPTSTTLEPPRAPLPDPCGAETATIRAAIDDGIDGARDGADIDTCRIAPVDTTWAAVNLVARAGSDFTPVTVLLQGGGGTWAIVDRGQANVGCGTAPQPVLVDLGVVCTSTGGGGV